jgi:hypothetical protein
MTGMTGDRDDDATALGEVPVGVGPEVFRERLERAANQDPHDGAVVVLEGEELFLADIEAVEAEDDHRSRVRLRNGLIIGGVTGAAIVGALAAVRYHRRRKGPDG